MILFNLPIYGMFEYMNQLTVKRTHKINDFTYLKYLQSKSFFIRIISFSMYKLKINHERKTELFFRNIYYKLPIPTCRYLI